ncbi:hypothetical protein [Streptomyces sp. NPDC047061]|uniref:hypothetical protein n=1 Tax=Streptomyces sp. NPDC047061 TaxID=3154605 RepID=UPI0033E8F12E
MNAPVATAGGTLAISLTALAHTPWPIVSVVTGCFVVVSSAQRLVNAWNTLMRGVYERRALRASEPAEVLAHLSRTPASGDEDPAEPEEPR